MKRTFKISPGLLYFHTTYEHLLDIMTSYPNYYIYCNRNSVLYRVFLRYFFSRKRGACYHRICEKFIADHALGRASK